MAAKTIYLTEAQFQKLASSKPETKAARPAPKTCTARSWPDSETNFEICGMGLHLNGDCDACRARLFSRLS